MWVYIYIYIIIDKYINIYRLIDYNFMIYILHSKRLLKSPQEPSRFSSTN